MDEVNQELFLEMLLKLEGSRGSIEAASKWCRTNAQYHQEVPRMWFFAVAKATTMVQRLDLFHLVSDILFTADARSIIYFSSFLPQLVKAIPLVRGEEIKLSMNKLFSLWREKNIYNKPVMDRLDKLLRNRNKVVDMNIFRYDRELLFKNLHRIQDLKPACDYLMKGMEHSPSFDDSQGLMSTIKDQRACNSLLSVVDSHKNKVTSLVSYLEEMVHLLKMTTMALDIAANREQNGIEETKLKIMAYDRYNEKVLSLSHWLESNYILKKDSTIPMTLASPEPDETSTLFSRRADFSSLESPGSPPFFVNRVSVWNPQTAVGFPAVVAKPEIFHRMESYWAVTPARERTMALDIAANREQNGIEETKLKIMACDRSDEKVLSLMHRLESCHISKKDSTIPMTLANPSNVGPRTPTRDPYLPGISSMAPANWASVTPSRDETPWFPAIPSYSGASWSTPAQSYSGVRAPVYQRGYTGINQSTDYSSPRPPLLPNPPFSSLMPFTTFMGPSSSGYTKQ